MIRDIDPIEEIRKHPGVTAGSLAALVLGAAAVLYLSQRTGPTRYQRIKTRIHNFCKFLYRHTFTAYKSIKYFYYTITLIH